LGGVMAEQTNIPNLSGLTELANRGGVDIKPTLLRVMTDLYMQKPVHTIEEEQHFTMLAKRLIHQVDATARATVAAKLAEYPGAPREVLEYLAGGQTNPKAQAGTNELERTPASTAPVNTSPANKPAATLAELSELFLSSDSEARRMILLHLEYADLPPAQPMAANAAEFVQRLETAALMHNGEAFAQELERALGIERTMARRLVDDESGEPILAVAHALAMPADVLQRVLLCLNPAVGHSVLRVYELSKLYEELDPQSATRLIAIWQTAHPAQRATASRTHQPQHHDDGKLRPTLPPRPAIRWEEHATRRAGEG
jgi:hypothetical protein